MAKDLEVVDQIVTNIETCRSALEKLKDTCCMAERSVRMSVLVESVNALEIQSDGTRKISPEELDATIKKIEKVGAALGQLYATCCTPTRERLYVEMFKALGQIHIRLWRLKGVSH